MKSVSLPPFLLIMLVMFSCSRGLEESQLLYRGKWESEEHTLIIYSNSKGSCIQKKLGLRCNGYVTITDRKIVFTSNTVDAHVFRVKFSIHQKPETDTQGITYMILNGERFEQ